MAQTVWNPYEDSTSTRSWLLKDGTVVESPKFEISSSGRRVRVVGTTKSFSVHEISTLIRTAVDEIAKARGTEAWLVIGTVEEQKSQGCNAVGAYGAIDTAPELPDGTNGSMTHMTRFASGYIDAYLANTYAIQYGRMYVTTRLAYRMTSPDQAGTTISYYTTEDGTWSVSGYMDFYDPNATNERTWVNAAANNFAAVPLKQEYHTTTRGALNCFLTISRQIEDLEEISIPDFRVPGSPTTLVLKRAESNWHNDLERQITDILNAGPVVEELRKMAEEMTKKLRTLGFVITDEVEDSAFEAAAGGNLTQLKVAIAPGQGTPEIPHDEAHRVFLNLVTGHLEVTCAHDNDLRVEAGTAWEVAKFKAELTGETDELLAYAREYSRTTAEKKIRERDNALTAALSSVL